MGEGDVIEIWECVPYEDTQFHIVTRYNHNTVARDAIAE